MAQREVWEREQTGVEFVAAGVAGELGQRVVDHVDHLAKKGRRGEWVVGIGGERERERESARACQQQHVSLTDSRPYCCEHTPRKPLTV